MRARNRLPGPAETLALRVALLDGEEALAAWRAWLDAIGGLDAARGPAFAVLPLVSRNIGRIDPEAPELLRLRGIYRQAWSRNQVLVNEATKALRALDAAGIDTILLKGAALAAHYAPDIGARHMGDVDILVPHGEAARAIGALLASGWALAPRGRERPRMASEPTFVARNLRYNHGLTFRTPRGGDIDLHWLALMENADPAADANLRATAIPASLAGVLVRVPAPEVMALHVIVHGLRWFGEPRVRWVADAVAVIRHAGEAFEWGAFVDEARRRDLRGVAHAGVAYLACKVDVPVPPGVLAALEERGRPSFTDRVVRWSQAAPRSNRNLWAVRVTSYLGASARWPLHRRAWGVGDYMAHTWGIERRRDLPAEALSRLRLMRRQWLRSRSRRQQGG